MPLLVPSVISSSASVLDAHLRLPELRAKLASLLEAGSGKTTNAAPGGTTEAAADNLKRRLDIPAGLLDMVASHVIQEAEDEPYGLNGEREGEYFALIWPRSSALYSTQIKLCHVARGRQAAGSRNLVFTF